MGCERPVEARCVPRRPDGRGPRSPPPARARPRPGAAPPTVADHAGLGGSVGGRYVGGAHRKVLVDHVIDRRLERAPEALVIGRGEVEVHPRGAVRVQLRARDKRSLELLEDQGVEDMRAGVELAHQLAELGVDGRLHRARDLHGGREDVPELPARYFHADDRHLAPAASAPRRGRPADPPPPGWNGVSRARAPRDARRRRGSRWSAPRDVRDRSIGTPSPHLRASTRTSKCSARASKHLNSACASGSTTATLGSAPAKRSIGLHRVPEREHDHPRLVACALPQDHGPGARLGGEAREGASREHTRYQRRRRSGSREPTRSGGSSHHLRGPVGLPTAWR